MILSLLALLIEGLVKKLWIKEWVRSVGDKVVLLE